MAYRNTNMAPITGNFLDKKDNIQNIIDSSGAIKIASSAEVNTRDGLRFILSSSGTIAAGASVSYALNTNIAREIMVGEISILSDGALTLKLYENGSKVTAGANISPINTNRTVALQPTLKIFNGPTVAADGTEIVAYPIPTNIMVGVAKNMQLKHETVYLLKLTNNGLADVNFAMNIEWSESGNLLKDDIELNSILINGQDVMTNNIVYFDEGENVTEFSINADQPLYASNMYDTVYDGEDAYGTIAIDDISLNTVVNIIPIDTKMVEKESIFTVSSVLIERDGDPFNILLPVIFIQNIEIEGYTEFADLEVYKVMTDLIDSATALAHVEGAYKDAKITGHDAYTPIVGCEEVDAYNPEVAGSYSYKLILGDLPIGYTDKIDPTEYLTVDLVIIAATAFDALADINEAEVEDGLADAEAVIEYLETIYTNATLTGHQVEVPIISWEDTDTYDKLTAGSYTFTGTLGELPFGVVEAAVPVTTIEVEVIVE